MRLTALLHLDFEVGVFLADHIRDAVGFGMRHFFTVEEGDDLMFVRFGFFEQCQDAIFNRLR